MNGLSNYIVKLMHDFSKYVNQNLIQETDLFENQILNWCDFFFSSFMNKSPLFIKNKIKKDNNINIDFLKNKENNLSQQQISAIMDILSEIQTSLDESSKIGVTEDGITPKFLSDMFEYHYLKRKSLSKSTGSFYTPPKIAKRTIDSIIPLCYVDGEKITSEGKDTFKCLDPSCGCAEFLLQFADAIFYHIFDQNNGPIDVFQQVDLRKNIFLRSINGWDLNEIAIEISIKRITLWTYLPLLNSDIRLTEEKIQDLTSELEQYKKNLRKNLKCVDFFTLFTNSKSNHKINKMCKIPEDRFDIIIGNPPFSNKIEENACKWMKKNYGTIIKNTAAYFLILGQLLLKEKGHLGFIMPKSIAYSNGWNTVKNYVISGLASLEDISKAFYKVKLEQVILIMKKVDLKQSCDQENQKKNYQPEEKNSYFCNYEEHGQRKSFRVHKKYCTQTNPLIVGINKEEYQIFTELIENNQFYLSEIITAFRGSNIQKLAENISGNSKIQLFPNDFICCIGGKVVKGFGLKKISRVVKKEKIPEKFLQTKMIHRFLHEPKIIGQLANAHVLNPKPHFKLAFSYLPKGLNKTNDEIFDIKPSIDITTFDTVINIHLKNEQLTDFRRKKQLIHYLLCYLNSNLCAWYLYKIVYSSAIRSTRLDRIYLDKVIIHILNDEDQFDANLLLIFEMISKILITITQLEIHKLTLSMDFSETALICRDLLNVLIISIFSNHHFSSKEIYFSSDEIESIEKLVNAWDEEVANLLLNSLPCLIMGEIDKLLPKSKVSYLETFVFDTFQHIKKIISAPEFKQKDKKIKSLSLYQRVKI